MSNNIDIGPRKSMFILVVVIGCFSVLWPKVFYPMLVGNANHHAKPSPIDRSSGCCDVISEKDVMSIKIMAELCSTLNISDDNQTKQFVTKEKFALCRSQVLETCGIDINAFLKGKVEMGRTLKQILEEVRSINGSLCLKYNFGVDPWQLGVPHHTAKYHSFVDLPPIRQERPAHLNPDMLHPALRERGRAIPASHTAPRVVEGRPGPIPGMRPPMGGPGHVVPPPTKGTSTMSIVMPIYTIGIVVFFTYTLMKLMFKKPADTTNGLYPPLQPDPNFRKQVFEVDRSQYITRTGKDDGTTKLGWKERDTIVNAMSALLAEVDQQREEDERLRNEQQQNEVILNGTPPTTISNGHITSLAPDTKEEIIDQKEEIIEKKEEKKLESEKSEEIHEEPENEQTSVKVLGVEITASCEGGQKWSRPNTPLVVSPAPPPPVPEIKPEPQNIFLEGALPPQGQLLVSESATETEIGDDEDENAVVLSGKMTLSVINLDNIDKVVKNGTDFNTIDKEVEDIMDDDELPEESKYTTASNATAAENDCSVDEGHMTDEEELEED